MLVRESADEGDACSDDERRWDGLRCIRQMVSLHLIHCSDHPSRDLLPAPEIFGSYGSASRVQVSAWQWPARDTPPAKAGRAAHDGKIERRFRLSGSLGAP